MEAIVTIRRIFILVLVSTFMFSPFARADKGKEFFTSVIYGTLAGTLVGAATLAFTSNPGDNLNNVARGASYGLYAGILLGLYVTYALDDEPRDKQDEEDDNKKSSTPLDDSKPTPGGFQSLKTEYKLTFRPFLILPSEQQADRGIGAQFLEVKF
jgi:hypothetical protein